MVAILDAQGQPMRRRPALALQGNGNTPYDAADFTGEHTRDWRPYPVSQDGALNNYRDTIVSRVRDVVRNDGWASGAVTRIVDNAIGATFRPISKPDYRALAAHTGNKAFDAVWADEFRREADAHWRAWAEDPGKYCDAERSKWMALLFGVAFRHMLTDNDALAVMQWAPERIGLGRAHYATCVQLVDPDRLSNPQTRFDMRYMRGGVEIDDYGAAVAYHIRKAHQGDYWAAADSVMWERIEREDDFGRPIVVHYFEPDGASQHRGGNGVFTPVLQRLKMLFRYDVAELDGAVINAVMVAVAQSPFDHSLLADAIGDDEAGGAIPDPGVVNGYQEGRADFHNERQIRIGGSRVITAYPGETYQIVKPDRPNPNFAPFEKAVLRNVAAAAGMASHQVTNDYSDANYSSMRAALLEAWKTIHRRRMNFGSGFAGPIRSAWLEEAMEVRDFPLPAGAPSFVECRQAYSSCRWLGPGRGWIDPVAEKEGAVLGMAAGLSTLETEASENGGEDWESIADQLVVEKRAYEVRGLDPPVKTAKGQGSPPADRDGAGQSAPAAKPKEG